MKILAAITLMVVSQSSLAACRWVYVDHDYNSSTPAIQKQICDSVLDVPAIRTPQVQPIQTPSIKPLEPLRIPPIGTTKCRMERVYEDGKWVNKQVCS